MPLKFDATIKDLVKEHPSDWVEVVGLAHTGPVMIKSADVSVVSGDAGSVALVEDPAPWICHWEFVAGPDPELPAKAGANNVLLTRRFGIGAQSVLVLLRRKADSPRVPNAWDVRPATGRGRTLVEWIVWRVWQSPAEPLLAGGLGTLLLALLTDEAQKQLPHVIARVRQRLEQELPEEERKDYWSRAFVLLGLRNTEHKAATLLQGVGNMEESTTYQAILRRGEAIGEARGALQGERRMLVRLGEKRLGSPSPQVMAALDAIADGSRLEALGARLFEAETWEDLLALP